MTSSRNAGVSDLILGALEFSPGTKPIKPANLSKLLKRPGISPNSVNKIMAVMIPIPGMVVNNLLYRDKAVALLIAGCHDLSSPVVDAHVAVRSLDR